MDGNVLLLTACSQK